MNKLYKIIIFALLAVCVSFANAQNIKTLMAKASKGDASSQLLLGVCYKEGSQIAKNDSLAFYWLNRSARQGLAEAQVVLGHCYKEGVGVEKDSTKALELYKLAASCESSLAFDALGDCYYYGIAVKRDIIRARYYYSKAANRGYKKSKMKYDKIRFLKDDDPLIEF